jgi:hypothetical protein
MTGCIHRTDGGLCADCWAEAQEDPEAWEEYGHHPAGEANWKQLQAEIEAWAELPIYEPILREPDDEIPY